MIIPLRRNLDPGKPETGNAYTSPDESTLAFPAPPLTLSEALDALSEDKTVRAVLPAALYETFTACKRDECNRRSGAITDWDYNTYLRYTP